MARRALLVAAIAFVLVGCAQAVKDDAFIGYLDGQTVTALGVTQLAGAPITPVSVF